MMLG
jgi:importin-7